MCLMTHLINMFILISITLNSLKWQKCVRIENRFSSLVFWILNFTWWWRSRLSKTLYNKTVTRSRAHVVIGARGDYRSIWVMRAHVVLLHIYYTINHKTRKKGVHLSNLFNSTRIRNTPACARALQYVQGRVQSNEHVTWRLNWERLSQLSIGST